MPKARRWVSPVDQLSGIRLGKANRDRLVFVCAFRRMPLAIQRAGVSSGI